jgi:hypothetical protein
MTPGAWVSVAQVGRAKEAWLRTSLDLPNGIAAHDRFRRVFSLLDPKALEECFRAWVASIRQVLPEEIVAIDGKSLRRSHDHRAGLGPLHMVSAWAVASPVVLGQLAIDARSNTRESFAVLRHIALTFPKNDQSLKSGIKTKRLAASWNEDPTSTSGAFCSGLRRRSYGCASATAAWRRVRRHCASGTFRFVASSRNPLLTIWYCRKPIAWIERRDCESIRCRVGRRELSGN